MTQEVIHGDCRDVLQGLPDASVDSVVTDPPYELGFMGRAWDASGIAYNVDLWRECARVLKPGGHLLAFGGTRTVHRLTCAVEDAGFEIRDGIDWLYASGFPKSLDVSRAIDKAAGAQRETRPDPRWATRYPNGNGGSASPMLRQASHVTGGPMLTSDPATDDARRWSGWGTALKPAREPIVMARKPLAGTVAGNVLAYGTGALNINATRADMGRWPANVMLSHAPDCDDECPPGCPVAEMGESARFFPAFRYQAKAPARERPKADGVSHPTVKPLALMRWLVRLVTPPGGTVLDPFAGSGATVEACLLEGFRCVAIEKEATYLPLIQARMDRAAA